MQDLEWRPRYFSRGASPQTDPVELIVFSFYNEIARQKKESDEALAALKTVKTENKAVFRP